jgi:hypothetical protein
LIAQAAKDKKHQVRNIQNKMLNGLSFSGVCLSVSNDGSYIQIAEEAKMLALAQRVQTYLVAAK